jgi:hypothetical protein
MLIFINCSYCELKRSRKVGILYFKDEIVKCKRKLVFN